MHQGRIISGIYIYGKVRKLLILKLKIFKYEEFIREE